jgi:ligand-binding SRPBCC domain-containing protein
VSVHVLERRQRLDVPPERAFAFFGDARNLEAITPPWLRFRVVTPEPITMRRGTLIDYRLRLHGLPLRWRTRIDAWEPPHRFVDSQLRGPYALWEHTHTFAADGAGVVTSDRVRYALPRFAPAWFVRRDLDRIFDYRARAIAEGVGAAAFSERVGVRSISRPAS